MNRYRILKMYFNYEKNHQKIIDMTLYGVCNLKLIALVIIYKSLILNLQTGCNNKNS